MKMKVLHNLCLLPLLLVFSCGQQQEAVIPFEHALPAQNINGRQNGTYNNIELAIPGVLTTLDTDLGMMMKWLRDNVQSGRHTVFVEGEAIPTYKNWIRDHVHTMKAFRHWEYNLKAYLDFTLAYQRPDGSYYEFIKQMDDPHWSFVAEDDVLFFPEDNLYLARLDIESDIEYLVVEGAAEYYKATADRRFRRMVHHRSALCSLFRWGKGSSCQSICQRLHYLLHRRRTCQGGVQLRV